MVDKINEVSNNKQYDLYFGIFGAKMSKYVYIVKADAKDAKCVTGPIFILSTPLSLREAVQYCEDMSGGEKIDNSPKNRVVELFMPEKVFKQFRIDNPDTYYPYATIEAFMELNNKYRAQSLKLMSHPKEEGKEEVTAPTSKL